MANSPDLLMRLLSTSALAANCAGKIIRDVMKKGELGVVMKGKNDYQTEADRSAQLCIVGSLSRQFPNVTIIGEEGTSNCECPEDWVVSGVCQDVMRFSCPSALEQTKESDITVWVDPLDGTSEYTQGLLDHVTVLIGIAIKGAAVGGVIHQPYFNYKCGDDNLGRTIWGLEGLGVSGFDPVKPPEGQRIVTTTRSHPSPAEQTTLDAIKPDQVLRVGGAGHKVMLLMEGKAHAYVFPSAGTKRWDTCAPEAVLKAAGGKLTDMNGRFYSYDKNTPHSNVGGILATAIDKEHAWYLKQIPHEVRQQLDS